MWIVEDKNFLHILWSRFQEPHSLLFPEHLSCETGYRALTKLLEDSEEVGQQLNTKAGDLDMTCSSASAASYVRTGVPLKASPGVLKCFKVAPEIQEALPWSLLLLAISSFTTIWTQTWGATLFAEEAKPETPKGLALTGTQKEFLVSPRISTFPQGTSEGSSDQKGSHKEWTVWYVHDGVNSIWHTL